MDEQARELRGGQIAKLERAVLLQLLAEAPERRWSAADLAGAIGAPPDALEGALEGLLGADVVRIEDAAVRPSPAALRIDALGLIGI